MRYRTIGKDLKVSAVGLGCMGLSHAYGAPTEKKEAVKLIYQAVEIGYTFFDTAECYTGVNTDGTTSFNEEMVGEALKDCRDKVVIATKFGVKHTPGGLEMDSRPETIRKSVEGSLRRLGTDYIDLYYQHRIDPKIPIEEVAGVMRELIQEGKITHWGISEADEAHIRKAHAVCPLTAIQNRYSMMYREYDALFPVLEELSIGYVAFSPLANGLLSDSYTKSDIFTAADDYRSNMPQFKAEAYEENKKLLELVRTYAAEKHATPAQISLAWMISKKPYFVPIPGTRKESRLQENGKAADIKLTEQEVKAIDAALDQMDMSEVFGGTRLVKSQK